MAMHQMLKCDLIPLDSINQFTWGDLNIHENNRLLAGRHPVNTPEITVLTNDPYISSNGYYGYSPINVLNANANDLNQDNCQMETASINEGMENAFGSYPNCRASVFTSTGYSQNFTDINGLGAQHVGRRKRNYTEAASHPVKKIRSDDSALSQVIDQESSFLGAASSCAPSDTYPRCIMGHYI